MWCDVRVIRVGLGFPDRLFTAVSSPCDSGIIAYVGLMTFDIDRYHIVSRITMITCRTLRFVVHLIIDAALADFVDRRLEGPHHWTLFAVAKRRQTTVNPNGKCLSPSLTAREKGTWAAAAGVHVSRAVRTSSTTIRRATYASRCRVGAISEANSDHGVQSRLNELDDAVVDDYGVAVDVEDRAIRNVVRLSPHAT